ncbi:MAG: hypothetical protein GXY72_00190 [Deltaproteobacteria bacterium]|nr:hypothetical protein [Deltaproteobacteria bacterium]
MGNYSWLTQAVTNPGEYAGRQVVTRFNLLDIEIFDLLKNGLQAYAPGTYKRIVDEDNLKKRRKHSLEELERLEYLKEGTRETGRILTKSRSVGTERTKRTDDEIKREAKCNYEKQPEDTPIIPEGCKAFHFTLPDEDRKRNAAIVTALGFIFKAQDVEEYEQTHGINMQKSSHPSVLQEQPETTIEKQPELGNTQTTPPLVNFFHKESRDIWRIGHEGKQASIKHYDGFSYIAEILRQKPGESVSCIVLAQMVSSKGRGNIVSEDAAMDEGLSLGQAAQPINTSKTQTEYLNRYNQLRARLSEIEDLQEHIRPPDANIEKAEIEEEMSKIEIAMKEKTFAEPNAKKAQSNIKQRLNDAYTAIRKAGMKNLANYLEQNIKVDGAFGLRHVGTLAWEITIE